MTYSVVPKEKGFATRRNLTIGQMFHINMWMTFYRVDHTIIVGEKNIVDM